MKSEELIETHNYLKDFDLMIEEKIKDFEIKTGFKVRHISIERREREFSNDEIKVGTEVTTR